MLSVTKLSSPVSAQCLSAVASCLILRWKPQLTPPPLLLVSSSPALPSWPNPKGCPHLEEASAQLWVWLRSAFRSTPHQSALLSVGQYLPHFRLCCSLCACHLVFPDWTALLSLCFCTNLPLMALVLWKTRSPGFFPFPLPFPFLSFFPLVLLIPLRQPPWAKCTPCPLERLGRTEHSVGLSALNSTSAARASPSIIPLTWHCSVLDQDIKLLTCRPPFL